MSTWRVDHLSDEHKLATFSLSSVAPLVLFKERPTFSEVEEYSANFSHQPNDHVKPH